MKKILLILIPIAVVIFVMMQVDDSDDAYVYEIIDYWEGRNDFFLTSEASPFIKNNQAFKEIHFFDPNPDYKVSGTLNRFNRRETVELGNSDGTYASYLKFATVEFKVDGKSCSLLILKALGFGNQYLLAFGDATSGESTYGGGRYLDVVIGKSDLLTLDFNKAYNPYCAYFDDFTCPLPPIENLLEVSIEAGEKNYPY